MFSNLHFDRCLGVDMEGMVMVAIAYILVDMVADTVMVDIMATELAMGTATGMAVVAMVAMEAMVAMVATVAMVAMDMVASIMYTMSSHATRFMSYIILITGVDMDMV